jgi:hypothetical protein
MTVQSPASPHFWIDFFQLDDDEDVSPLGEYHDDDSDDDDGPQVNSRLGKSFRMEVIDDY